MYPWFRMAKELWKFRKTPLGPFDTHVSTHRCWPWDIDPFLELNNGRTLTLYDLGRLPLGHRTGVNGVIKARGWGMAVAGVSVRYRKRITAFQAFTMKTRLLGWDERFLYFEQSMWRGGDCASQALIRMAATRGRSGILPPAEVMQALQVPPQSPALPGWVQAWIAAEAERPWPPQA
jgi:acyl-CoA thioesterase FadM